jgi:hypothetical protein
MPRHAKSRPRRRSLAAIALGAGGAVIASGAIGYAANSPSGQVQACYDNTTGALRVVGSTPCSGSETAIDWAKAGPPGISTLYHGFHQPGIDIVDSQRPTAIVSTPALAAGAYAVTVGGQFSRPAGAKVTCYVALSAPIDARRFSLPHHEAISPGPEAEWLTQTDFVRNIKAGQRITWYCEAGMDPINRDSTNVLEGRITYASINAVPISAVHYSIKN